MSRVGRKLIRALTEGKDLFELYKGKKTRWEIIKLALYINPIFDPYWKVVSFFRIQQERIERLYAYGKHIWSIGEFDYNWHMELQKLSLQRLNHIMRHGNSVFNKTADRKMKTCINLLERMTTPWESYHEPYDEAFCKRWNFVDEVKLLTHPTNPGQFYTSRHAFRDSLSPEQQVQFDKEYKEVLFIEDKMFAQDMQLFCKLWSKHVRKWWD